jgi:hypothetical protein
MTTTTTTAFAEQDRAEREWNTESISQAVFPSLSRPSLSSLVEKQMFNKPKRTAAGVCQLVGDSRRDSGGQHGTVEALMGDTSN